MPDSDGAYQRILARHAEYERRGGWARPFINVAFVCAIALASAFGAVWYDGLHDVGEYAGMMQFPIAVLIGGLLSVVALICLAVTLIKFSKLPVTQRVLGWLPLGMCALVAAAAFLGLPPFHSPRM